MLTRDEFIERVAVGAGVSIDQIRGATQLRTDLDLDSIQLLDVIVLMDELGAELPEEMIPNIQTIDDLYDHYGTRLRAEERHRR